MFGIQLYSLVKSYFEGEGIKNDESERGLPYSKMYNEEYIEHLKDICDSFSINHNLNNEYTNEDELCEIIWDAQYKIDTKIREIFNKIYSKSIWWSKSHVNNTKRINSRTFNVKERR